MTESYFPVSSCSDEPTQGQVETLPRLGIESTTFILDHKLMYKARLEQAVGIKDLILKQLIMSGGRLQNLAKIKSI